MEETNLDIVDLNSDNEERQGNIVPITSIQENTDSQVNEAFEASTEIELGEAPEKTKVSQKDSLNTDFHHIKERANDEKRKTSTGIKTKKLITLARDNTVRYENMGVEKKKREQFKKDIENADKDKDGDIDAAEFEELYAKYPKELKVLAYNVQVSCNPPPLFIISMAVLQAVTYTAHYYSTPPPHTAYCSFLIMDTCRRSQIWRYFTYAFVHSGHDHIMFNILFKCMVGITLEMSQPGWTGKGRVALVYFSGVLLGSLGGSLTNSDYIRFHAGSSAGVYALIAAYLASLILNWKEEGMSFLKPAKENRECSIEAVKRYFIAKWEKICVDEEEEDPELHPLRVPRYLRLAKFIFVISYAVLDTYAVIANHVNRVETSTGTMGHFMGFLGGLLMGIVFLKNWKKERYEKPLKLTCFSIYFLLVVIMISLQWEGDLMGYPNTSNTTVCPANCTYNVLYNCNKGCQIFNLEASGHDSNRDDSHF